MLPEYPGGVNVLVGDGSVRFVKSTIDGMVWRALGTIAGGEDDGRPLVTRRSAGYAQGIIRGQWAAARGRAVSSPPGSDPLPTHSSRVPTMKLTISLCLAAGWLAGSAWLAGGMAASASPVGQGTGAEAPGAADRNHRGTVPPGRAQRFVARRPTARAGKLHERRRF